MIRRCINILLSNSFFLFGARGTGKTSLLKAIFAKQNTLWIDLLKPKEDEKYSLNPERLIAELDALKQPPKWVVIDEVQKIPELLDVVHLLIEERDLRFALTGSSARKLKRGGANLLAGRAFVYKLFPFTASELTGAFDLSQTLAWGSLPKLQTLKSDEERQLFLESYCHTYLKEEILTEQLIRKLVPFRRFLEVASQSCGEVINYSKIAEDAKIDDKTAKSYFEILEDTLLGFSLPSYSRSVRKQLSLAPKFYLFDNGVTRALSKTLHIPLEMGQSNYGTAFEQFLINEIHRLNHYCRDKYHLSYVRTKDGQEIDLVLERAGEPTILIEIKSTSTVQTRHLKHLNNIAKDFENCTKLCLSQEAVARKEGDILIMPWQQGLQQLNLLPK